MIGAINHFLFFFALNNLRGLCKINLLFIIIFTSGQDYSSRSMSGIAKRIGQVYGRWQNSNLSQVDSKMSLSTQGKRWKTLS